MNYSRPGNQNNVLGTINQLDKLAKLDLRQVGIDDLLDDSKFNSIFGGGVAQNQPRTQQARLNTLQFQQQPGSNNNINNNNLFSISQQSVKRPVLQAPLPSTKVEKQLQNQPGGALKQQKSLQQYDPMRENLVTRARNPPTVVNSQSNQQPYKDPQILNPFQKQSSQQQQQQSLQKFPTQLSPPPKAQRLPEVIQNPNKTPQNIGFAGSSKSSHHDDDLLKEDDKPSEPVYFLGADLSSKDPNFDPRAKEDLIDEETLKKIEDFKRKYQEMKDKAEENERELAYSSIKVDELVDKIKELENKKNEFRDQLFNETKNNAELRRKLADLEDDKIALEQQLETGFKPSKMTKLKEVNLAKHKQLMEEKAKREREEMRRQVLVGIDFVGQKDDLRILLAAQKGFCSACWERFKVLIEKLTPLNKDLKKISSNYDKSIEGFFQFFRFLVGASLMVFLLYQTLLIHHLILYDYDRTDICQKLPPIPCFTLYSRFSQENDFFYSLTLLLFVICGVSLCFYKFVQFDLLRRRRQLYEDQKLKFAKIFFNCWDWQINNNFEYIELKQAIKTEIKLNIDEDKIKEVVKKRKQLEKTKLLIRRLITMIINVFVLCSGFNLIVALNYYNQTIQDYFKGIKVLSYIASFVPTICLSIINMIVPIVTKKITAYEAWDFQDQLIKQQVWRMYLAKILNLAIFVVLNLELATDSAWFSEEGINVFNEDNAGFDCREDQAGSNMMRLIMTEFALNVILELVFAFVNKLVFGIIKGRRQWQAEYDLSKQIVWLLYFQAILWVSQIYYPYITVVAPAIMFVLFKFFFFALRKLHTKPKKSSNANDTGYFIMIFLNITFFSVKALVIIILVIPYSHYQWESNQSNLCGPYESGVYGHKTIEQMLEKSSVAETIYSLLKFQPFLWLQGILLITLMFFKRNHASLLKTFVSNKDNEYQQQIEELQKSIVKLEKKIEYNKMAQF